MGRIVTALVASAALALGAGASAAPASAQDLIEYALMANVPAATGAQPSPDGAFTRAAGTTVELTDFTIDPTFIAYDGESMLFGAGIDFWVDDARVDVIDSYQTRPLARRD